MHLLQGVNHTGQAEISMQIDRLYLATRTLLAQHTVNRRSVAIEILQSIDEENDHALAPGVFNVSFFTRRGAGRQNPGEEQEKP
jgi:hypothetical protein